MKEAKVSLADLLFPARGRRQILSTLLLSPNRSLHVRELARQIGAPPGAISKELAQLRQAGLVSSTKVGNQMQYRAETAHPVFADLASLLRKTVGLADPLREALLPLRDDIRSAFIFGSAARGEERAGSDIDVMVIGHADFGRVVDVLYPVQQTLQREISPMVFGVDEWRAKQKDGSTFVSEVLDKPKIFLIGGPDDIPAA